ncbi:cyclase [Saccharothrix carnea]|uniref:Cyclase n=1 Tax=Saccharothrix carnea TaxID=1280637 RepID=A0A2P8I2I4_SACCR|nr:MBL fold metallo-hydrolase [Saccharothrix carnea]PSL52674.1 cyclase [Saccharothrix carnea]
MAVRRGTASRLEEVADGVFAHEQPDGGWCLSNAGVVVSDGEAVVVDTAATEERARRFRDAVASVASAAPRVVVNTHFHGDHTFGNSVFQPEAVVVAHEAARTEAGVADLGMCGLWPDVTWGDLRVALPQVTYRDRATVHAGGVPLELIHPGPAHTTTDTLVWVPDRSVLFAGDVVLNGATPFCLMGSVSGSLRTLELIRALEPAVIVPGHGPVGGPELLDATEAYFRWLRDLARDGVDAGLTPLELARETDLGAFAELLDAERLVGNLHRAYAEQRGAPEGTPLDVLAVFLEMVEHHGGPLPCRA